MAKQSNLSVEFEVGRALSLRPNQVVRGAVVLAIFDINKSIWASTIKIKLRGEETASAKIKDAVAMPGIARTVYFECSYTVWCGSAKGHMKANEYRPWKELNSGVYRFEFALKLPAVNFPPSVEGPKGFSIRYVWQPIIESAGGTLIEGSDVVTPFVPITFAPPDQEWSYRETLYHENKQPKKILIYVEAILPKHVYSPGEEMKFTFRITNYSAGRITCIQCSLRKHFEGPLDKEFICENHERSLVSAEKRCNILTSQNRNTGEMEFSLVIPQKHHHVPPTFAGRHLRLYYTIRCVIQAEMGKLLTKMQYYEVIIPISIASFPHVPHEGLSNLYPSYTESRTGPYFFDPREDFPPDHTDIHNPHLNTQLNDLCDSNYFDSLSTHSPDINETDSCMINDDIIENTQRVTVIVNNTESSNERNERTLFTTRTN